MIDNVINAEAATKYLENVQVRDPITAALIRRSYQVLFMSERKSQCDFDLLFYFQLLEELFEHKQQMIGALQGIYDDDKVWGND